MKRKFVIYFLGVVSLAAAGLAAYHITRHMRIASVLAAERSPYVIWFRDATYRAKIGQDIDYTEPHDSVAYLKARAADGSIGEITFASYSSQTKYTIGVRKTYSIRDGSLSIGYPRSNVKSTTPLRNEELVALKALPPDPTCVHHPDHVGPSRFLGTGSFQGVAVAKHEMKPSARSVWEIWESPDLDCASVYVKTTLLDEQGVVTGATIRSAFEIHRLEPEAWMISAEGGTEMAPSKALAAEFAAAGDRTDGHSEHIGPKVLRHDEDYFRRWRELRPR